MTNNVFESFNSHIRILKGLLIHELVDGLREMIMHKRYRRRMIGRQMEDEILPNVMKELNIKVSISDQDFAEVTLID